MDIAVNDALNEEPSVDLDEGVEELKRMLDEAQMDGQRPESRPPSYNTLSLGKQVAEESARTAAIKLNAITEAKRIVSVGDDPQVDCVEVKTPVPMDSDNDDDEEERENFHGEISKVNFEDLMRAIKELQCQQDQLKQMQEEHDKKWQDFLSHQPQVNDQLHIIRKKSIKQGKRTGFREAAKPASDREGSDTYDNAKRNNAENRKKTRDGHSSGTGRCDVEYANLPTGQSLEVAKRRPTKDNSDPNRKAVVEGTVQNALFQHAEQRQSVYVQLEYLYNNLQRLHVPSKTMCDVIGGGGLFAMPFNQGQTVHPGAYVPPGEMERLLAQNKELQMKIKDLEAELKKARERTPPKCGPPPVRKPPPPPPKTICEEAMDRRPGQFLSPRDEPRGCMKRFVPGRPTSPVRPHLKSKDIFIRCITVDHRIPKYWEKRREEQVRPGSKQISGPFYTAHGGYRLQFEVFLNGDGTGRGKCMSVFVRVIQGENDSTLKWPVNLNVQFGLLDQTNTCSARSIRTSGNQFQFMQPRGSSDLESDSWGLIEFVSHKEMNYSGFIKGGAIRLQFKLKFVDDETEC